MLLRSYAATLQPLTGRDWTSPKKQNHAETAVRTGLPCGSSSESPPETFTNFSARYSLVSFAYPTFQAQEHYRAENYSSTLHPFLEGHLTHCQTPSWSRLLENTHQRHGTLIGKKLSDRSPYAHVHYWTDAVPVYEPLPGTTLSAATHNGRLPKE